MQGRHYILLMLVFVMAACGPQDPDVRRWSAAETGYAESSESLWHFDTTSDFHGVLPVAVQVMLSVDPHEIATAVCVALGGELDFMLSPNPIRNELPFNCAFTENGTRTSVELGELRRIRENSLQG